MQHEFKMVAKTLKGLEAVLADELRALGANNVEPGRRMVAFTGDLAMLYKANLWCRTALRILKPFCTFRAGDPDALYDRCKEFDWDTILTPESTFAIESTVNSESFTHSRFVTYRVKDAIADWFADRYDRRPGVRVTNPDVLINVHINDHEVTLSLDSSGDSLHKRGWRQAQTEAPINEVLAAGILLIAGYDGSQPLVDPMCGSGTFLIEAAMIAANIPPGIYRTNFAFEHWRDFDAELFDSLYNDDSHEREVTQPIIGCDINASAVDITRRNLRGAGVAKYVTVEQKALALWEKAPAAEGMIVTNPPYGERISAPDMDALYEQIGSKLKHVFTGWKAWIIGYHDEYFKCIGLAPSERIALLNGSLDCELREYIIFAGNKRDFRAAGGKLKRDLPADKLKAKGKPGDRRDRRDRRDERPGDRFKRAFDRAERRDGDRKPFDRKPFDRKPFDRNERKPRPAEVEANEAEVMENPLAKRRNPHALKNLVGKQPELPKSDGPIMRSRGWRKKD